MGSIGIDPEEFEAVFAADGIDVDASDLSNIFFYLPSGETLSVTLFEPRDDDEALADQVSLWKRAR